MLFPEPATELQDRQEELYGGRHEELTYPMDPQEGTSRPPFIKDTPLKEPF